MRVLDLRAFQNEIANCDSVVLEQDTYIVERADALRDHFVFSNSDDLPIQYFGAIIRNKKRLTIDGNGSKLIFRGPMTPFAIVDSAEVTIRNLTIEFDPPLVAEGEAVAVCKELVDIAIDREKFPCVCRDGWLYFDIHEKEFSPMCHRAQIHFERDRTVAQNSGDDFVPERVEELEGNRFRFYPKSPVNIRVGEVFVLRHNARTHPGIFVENSYNTVLEDVTFHGAGGLGVLAQFCENLTMRRINFLPGDGMFVANGRDDGLHATTCRGNILIEDCSFLGLMDDPINIHGCATKLERISDDRRVLYGRYMHEQAKGFSHYAQCGDELQLIRRDTMQGVKCAVAQEYRLLTDETFQIILKEPINLPDGDFAIENISATPEVRIYGCRFGSCRARGLLITTPKPVVILDNLFESSGSAILLSGDANYWYESGACFDVTIERNVFTDRCMSSEYEFCEGIISIAPVVPCPKVPFHRNIRIWGNVFDTPNSPIVSAFSVKDLCIDHNRIFISPARGNICGKDALVALSWCEDVGVVKNRVVGMCAVPYVLQEDCKRVQVDGKEISDEG